jgi:hypothetical protein
MVKSAGVRRSPWLKPGRAIPLTVGALLLAGVVAVAVLLAPPRQTSTVAAPPGDATPEQVVATYIDALNAHDCTTAQALTAPGFGPSTSVAFWCHEFASLTDVVIHDHYVDDPRANGRTDVPGETVGVGVSFTVHSRPLHVNPAMPDGPNPWGYLLTRADANSPWRIYDQGLG